VDAQKRESEKYRETPMQVRVLPVRVFFWRNGTMTTPLDRLPAAILDRFLAGDTLADTADDFCLSLKEAEGMLRKAMQKEREECDRCWDLMGGRYI